MGGEKADLPPTNNNPPLMNSKGDYVPGDRRKPPSCSVDSGGRNLSENLPYQSNCRPRRDKWVGFLRIDLSPEVELPLITRGF